ncbi:hypothetical protein [Candidatus Erwinia dacicola]|uniref:hypothetical protein n=1 Tax=Candidatus Erwinia dacicola TaxID=252393 RepID=UPI0021C377D1|nr:hypothetical protein [Candidatus Erwinia dacicola]
MPQDTLSHGLVQRQDILITLLQRWRRQLLSRISLRVGLPPQLMMQRQLTLPTTQLQLHEPERSSYITVAARRFFPIAPKALVPDYRCGRGVDAPVYLTAERQEALHSWQIELTPAALFALADSLRLDPATTLVHRLSDHWLRFAPQHRKQPWD